MTNIISIKNLNKSYKVKNKTILVFNNYDIEIEQSKIVAIMGRSGSGKSTILQILGLLDKPDSGDVNYFGVKIDFNNSKKLFEYRSNNIGFVFQSFYLMPELTVYENVELPLLIANIDQNERKIKVEEVLNSLGILDKQGMMPNQISGGQIQRVAIARAIVNNPGIILADEPTGNLDEITAKEVMSILKNIQKKYNTTIIIVTHSHEIASQCDNIINLENR